MKYIRTLLLIISFVTGIEYNIVILTDLHYNEDYMENIAEITNCKKKEKNIVYTIDRAPWGRYGCDSPGSLVRSSIMKAQQVVRRPDVVLVLGDLAAHKVSCDVGSNCSKEKREKLKRVMSNVTKEISLKFPMIPIMHVMGNTDGVFHNQVPTTSEKNDYYGFLYDIYIKKHLGNKKLDTTENQKTFMNGGYYYYDLTNKLRILAVNSMNFFKLNDKNNDPNAAKDQMKWINHQLETY